MSVHNVSAIIMIIAYIGSLLFCYPAYMALVVYACCYVVYYVPDIIISVFETLGDILSSMGDICD